jgi:hypothetical protein
MLGFDPLLEFEEMLLLFGLTMFGACDGGSVGELIKGLLMPV